MVEVVGETIDRMHEEFAHSIPRGIAIEGMIASWSAALTRNGVPPESVPQCYDAACDSRTRRGVANFMPTVHDLVAEWLKVATDINREQAHELQQKYFQEQKKRAVPRGQTSSAKEKCFATWRAEGLLK